MRSLFFLTACGTIALALSAARASAQATLGQPIFANDGAAGSAPGYGETPITPTGPVATGPATLPIDLATALRLANASNPTIGFARARVDEAYQRLKQADILWLPNLTVGAQYIRHDGQLQDVVGRVFATSKSNVFSGGGLTARFDLADAFFLPLVARRLTEAEASRAESVSQNIQLDAALAYFDLLQVYGAVAVNADTLARAEQMLNRSIAADKAGLNKTKADVNRAETEVNLRRQEAIVLRGRAAAASARLVRILLLDPNVELVPADDQILPLTLVPPSSTVASLIELGQFQRPDLAAAQSLTTANETRERQARVGPFMPKVQLDYISGTFGGGINSTVDSFSSRGDGTAALFWEFRNLGFGNLRQIKERHAQTDQTRFQEIEIRARVAAEISESAKLAGARFQSLDAAQRAVTQALEMYRKLLETSFGMIAPRAQYDALEPLLAIQALNQARSIYLNEVIEFNRAQFRLYTALGQPALNALPTMATTPLAVNVVPSGRIEPVPK